MLRTHRQSYASCLDITSKFLNPVTQSLSFGSSSGATDGDTLSTGTEYYQSGEESSSDDDEGIVVSPTSFDDQGMHRHRRRSVSENNLSFHL